MKKIAALALLLACGAAQAQTATPDQAMLNHARQQRNDAADATLQCAGSVAALTAQLAAAQKEAADLKAKYEPKKDEVKK